MSKIGRKPIELGAVKVVIEGNEVRYTGKKATGVHVLPPELKVELANAMVKITPSHRTSTVNAIWGLHRALLANKIKGADVGFERQLRIVGLGFKGVVTGQKIQLSLGFSHRIDYDIPQGVTIEADKTGQLLTLRSSDKMVLGQAASFLRGLRPPEPYKGTGIQYTDEVIFRKAGKAKSAA